MNGAPSRPYLPYIVPFALYFICTSIPPLLTISAHLGYPLKTLVVAASLMYFLNAYGKEIRFSLSWFSVISGVVVFVVWVLPEGLYPQIGHSEFNPYEYESGYGVYLY